MGLKQAKGNGMVDSQNVNGMVAMMWQTDNERGLDETTTADNFCYEDIYK